MDVWPWVCGILNSDEWPESSPLVYELATSEPAGQSIELRAERSSEPNSSDGASVTFSLCFRGLPYTEPRTLWVSDACPLHRSSSFVPLVSRLTEEVVLRSPAADASSAVPRSRLRELLDGAVARVADSHGPESFSAFFNVVLLARLFWLCACDSPSEVGSLYFRALLAPNLAALSCTHAPVLRLFLISVGADVELGFMRALGYMLAKWLILAELGGVGISSSTPSSSPSRDRSLGFSYAATEAHGLWVLKGYAPVLSMKRMHFGGEGKEPPPLLGARESVLKYALAHQQLEAVIQLEHSVRFLDGHVQVKARVDNLRFHVARLVYGDGGDPGGEEGHSVSRIRIRVGPELGSAYVAGLSLTRSTEDVEREVDTKKSFRGSFGKRKNPKLVAKARTAVRARTRSWRWDQDAEGNAAVFDAALRDPTSGADAVLLPPCGEQGGSGPGRGQPGRPLAKTGRLVFAGDKYGEEVTWRLRGDVAGGSVLRWRIGAQIWVTHWPGNLGSASGETRLVEWNHEVDLSLVQGN